MSQATKEVSLQNFWYWNTENRKVVRYISACITEVLNGH